MIKKLVALGALLFASGAQAICIPTGIADQYIYFVAVDSTDFTTRETGLSSFTVYRSRNGGSAAAYTTPTITETDASNMPGVYQLLVDENTTITGGNDEEEMVLHITHAGMAPVTRAYTLCNNKITYGETLTVLAGVAESQVQGVDADAITAAAIATDAIGSAEIAASAIGASEIAGSAIGASEIAADAIGASELAADAVTEIAAGVAAIVCDDQDGGLTLQECMSVMLSVLAGESSVSGSIVTYKTEGGTENRATVTFDSSGNRTSVTLTPVTP